MEKIIFNKAPVVVRVGEDSIAYHLGNCTDIQTDGASGGVNLFWSDPADIYHFSDKYGFQEPIALWKKTRVYRKEGAIPADENDGELVTVSEVRDQYSESPFTDTTAQDGVTYGYLLVPESDKGTLTIDPENGILHEGKKSYPQIFVNADGSVLYQYDGKEGDMAVYGGSTPVNPFNATWLFAGKWKPELSTITGPMTYYAEYNYPTGWQPDTTWEEYMPTLDNGTYATRWQPGIKILTFFDGREK